MSKETEAMDSAIAKVRHDQGTNESLKVTLITEIVDVFKAFPNATPEMVLQGKWASGFVGRTYGAWYVVKSDISASLINVPFVAKNFDAIKVQSSAKTMEDELTRVYKEVKATRDGLTASDKASGKAFNDNLVEANNAVVLVKNTHTVYSEVADTNLALLEATVASLRAQLNVAKRIKEESLSKVG
jgi:hypothetical protein